MTSEMSSKRIDHLSRVIAASPARLYRALLDAEARVAWLPPQGMVGRMKRFDPRVGGGYAMVLTYEDPSHGTPKSSDASDEVEARFIELVPDQRVVVGT